MRSPSRADARRPARERRPYATMPPASARPALRSATAALFIAARVGRRRGGSMRAPRRESCGSARRSGRSTSGAARPAKGAHHPRRHPSAPSTGARILRRGPRAAAPLVRRVDPAGAAGGRGGDAAAPVGAPAVPTRSGVAHVGAKIALSSDDPLAPWRACDASSTWRSALACCLPRIYRAAASRRRADLPAEVTICQRRGAHAQPREARARRERPCSAADVHSRRACTAVAAQRTASRAWHIAGDAARRRCATRVRPEPPQRDEARATRGRCGTRAEEG